MTDILNFLDNGSFDSRGYEEYFAAEPVGLDQDDCFCAIQGRVYLELLTVPFYEGLRPDLFCEKACQDTTKRCERLVQALAALSVYDQSNTKMASDLSSQTSAVEKEEQWLDQALSRVLQEVEWTEDLLGLHFSLLVYRHDLSSAAELLRSGTAQLNSDQSCRSETLIAELQAVLLLLSHASIAGTVSAEATSTSTGFQDHISRLFYRHMRDFIIQYRALIPLLAVAIRSSLLNTALDAHRYEVVDAILAHPWTLPQLEHLYAHLSSLSAEDAHTTTTSSSIGHTALRGGGGGAVSEPPSTTASIDPITQSAHPNIGEGESDEGYRYLRNISREDAIKSLYPLPVGSFLLRPHETLPEQYFLSFRTGHLGRSTSGKDAVVKHAIIRRTLRDGGGTAALESVTSVATESGRGSGSGEHEGRGAAVMVLARTSSIMPGTPQPAGAAEVEGNSSPLPSALRSSSPTNLTASAAVSSSAGSSALTESWAASGGAQKEVPYLYQCGKIGPCSSLMAMLREISAVLEHPLRFTLPEESTPSTPFTPTAESRSSPRSPLRQGGKAEDKAALRSDSTVAVPRVGTMDINAPLWERLRGQRSLYSAQAGSNQSPSSSSLSPQDSWRIADSSISLCAIYRETVKVLVLEEYSKQLAPALDLCNFLAQHDCDQASKTVDVDGAEQTLSAAQRSTRAYYNVFQQCLQNQCPDRPHLEFEVDDDEPASQPFSVLIWALRCRIHAAECALRTMLLPQPPYHSWYSPPLDCMLRVPNPFGTSATTATTTATTLPTFAPSDELHVAEHLLHLLNQAIGAKDVRLSNSHGTEHVVLRHCLMVEEVHRVVQLWRELFIQNESLVTQRIAAKRLAERAKASAASKDVPKVLVSDAPDVSHESAPSALDSEFETSIVSTVTSTTATTLSLDAYATLKRASALVLVDVTTATKDFVRRIIEWLSDELQLLYEITKPGDYAFSASQRYYCPRHPWEVRVLRDFTQAGERVRLGRNIYTSTPSMTSNSGGGGSGIGGSGSGRVVGAEGWSPYFVQFVAPALLRNSSRAGDSERDRAVSEFWTIWERLSAETYLHHTLSAAALDPVGEEFAVPAGSGSQKPADLNSRSYSGTLEAYMYRNNCYRRLGLLHRTVPLVQVDLYGLQEVLAVRAVSATVGAQAPVSIPSGVSPITYMTMFNKPTVLTATTTTHAGAALDIYAVMRLAPAKSAHSVHSGTAPASYSLRSAAASGASTPIGSAAAAGAGALSAKHCPLGGVVTSVHKAEARRTPLEQSDPTAGTIGGVGPGAPVVPNTWYRQQQAAIARAVEYNWRDQALFRFPLPEGQHYVHYPPSSPTVVLHPYGDTSKPSTNANSGPAAASPLALAASTAVVVPPPPGHFEVPSVLVIAVYERTFFSDTLLGELELDLAPLNGKRVIRGWYPLTLDRSISWLVYLQVRLKLQEMYVEPPGSSRVGSGGSGAGSAGIGGLGEGSSEAGVTGAKATSAMSARIIKQMDDLY